MSGWRTAVRIAAREARRAKGRTVLVLLMITLPVVGLAFAAVTVDMFDLRPAEKLDRELGTAQARVQWNGREPVQQDVIGENSAVEPGTTTGHPPLTEAELVRHLPAGSRAIRIADGYLDVRTNTGLFGLQTLDVDAASPLTHGMVEVVAGRAPRRADEVAATDRALARLGVGLGGQVRSADRKQTFTVVGRVELPADLGETLVRLPIDPRTLPRALPGALPGVDDTGGTWLVATPDPVTWDAVRELNALGMVVRSRALVLDPPTDAPGALPPADTGALSGAFRAAVIVGGLGLLEVVLLAGPAFAIGARRRRRDLALVAANGGTSSHLRRIVLADGLVLGAAGAVLGVAAGVALAFAARPLVEVHIANERAGGYRIYPLALAVIAGLALLTGLLAATVPAVAAARQDVVAALTGRRGQVRARRRWILGGALLVVAGAALAGYGALRVRSLMILGGLVVAELGLVVVTPAIVGLVARLGPLLPLGPRIALRDTARNRAAAAPAISAVMAAVAGCVALGTFLISDSDRQASTYRPGLPLGSVAVRFDDTLTPMTADATRAVLAKNVQVTDLRAVAGPACPADASADASCGLSVQLPPERVCPFDTAQWPLPDEQRRAALADPRCNRIRQMSTGAAFTAVVDDGTALPLLTAAPAAEVAHAREVLRAGGVVVSDPDYVKDGKVTVTTGDEGKQRTLVVPGTALAGLGYVVTVYPPDLPARLGLRAVAQGYVASTAAVPSRAAEDRLRADFADASGAHAFPYVERGADTERDTDTLVLVAAAVLVALGATAVATGLAAAEGRGDLSTLAAVGASPGIRRVLSLSQSGVVAGLGSVLGAAAGLVAGLAILAAFNRQQLDRWPVEPSYPLSVPWSSLALLLAIPVLAMLGAGLFTRTRLPIERRLG